MSKLIQKLPLSHLSHRFLLIFVLSLYVATAHILLPAFNKKEFYFLFQWSVFSSMPTEFVYDLTWNKRESFLFRDHKEELRSIARVDVFYYLIETENLERIRKDYKEKLLKLCQCSAIYFVKLKGSLSDHFIHKRELEMVKSIKL